MRTYGHTADFKSGAIPVADTKFEFIEVVPQVAAFRRMILALVAAGFSTFALL